MIIGKRFTNSDSNGDDDSARSNPLHVQTTSGPILGYEFSWSDGSELYGWQGIPFASPPTNDLRWRAPIDPVSWTNTLECKDMKPACVQNSGSGQEDCLYLNVYVNAKPANKGPYPVLFYIHGGGLMGGSTADDQFGGFISHAGNGDGIVVVQASYRLNIFGFLATSELSYEQNDHSGNYGIQDQIKALQWVRDNIAQFSKFITTICCVMSCFYHSFIHSLRCSIYLLLVAVHRYTLWILARSYISYLHIFT